MPFAWNRDYPGSIFGGNAFGEKVPSAGGGGSDVLLTLDFTTTSKPSEVDTYNRASTVAPITGTDANGAVVTKFASGQYAYEYNTAYSHGSKLGCLFEKAGTNLVQNSEDISASEFGTSSVTQTLNSTTAPDGTTTADTLGFNGSSSWQQWADSLSAGTYTHSFFAKTASGTVDVVVTYRENFTVVTTENFTVTDQWQRFQIVGTTGTLTTNRVRITNDSGGAADILVWGFQQETGTGASSYIPSSGGTASRVRTEAYVSNAYTNGYIDHEEGRVEVTYVPYRDQVVNQFYFRFSNGSSNNDKKLLNANTGGRWLVHNSAGASVIDITNGAPTTKSRDQEYDRSCFWDANSVGDTGGTTVDADTDTFDYGTYSDGTQDGELYVGTAQISGYALQGSISLLTIYSTKA